MKHVGCTQYAPGYPRPISDHLDNIDLLEFLCVDGHRWYEGPPPELRGHISAPGALVVICPRCQGQVLRDRGAEIDGKPAHQVCAAREERTRREAFRLTTDEMGHFIADWNAHVPMPTLKNRYGRTRGAIDSLVTKLRREGYAMVDRKGRYRRLVRKPSPLMVEAHDLTSAGAFQRNKAVTA